MPTSPLPDLSDRYALSNELHARPFPELKAPCRAVYVAIKQEHNAAERDREQDRAHLIDLLDRFGAPHPAPGANHHSAKIGNSFLKWEQHTEFVTYTIFADGVAKTPFDGSVHAMFPGEWLASAPGKVVTSCLVRIEAVDDRESAEARVEDVFAEWFVAESMAASHVIDGAATLGGDFRIDTNGHVRFAILARRDIGERRLGRIVQRVLEIETYKAMAMLTLPHAREVARKTAELDSGLAQIVAEMESSREDDQATLERLLKIAADIEKLTTSTAFRFGAAGAYEAIVNQRIEVLREERCQGRQTFGEFMMRRFDPAMRTCRSAELRLNELARRAGRTANLLRTRVDVASAAQNVEVLRRMDERAALQLRLQETVEGLSVVAISYYGVNLAANLIKPLAKPAGIGEAWVYAALTPVVVGLVWASVRRIRKRIAVREYKR
jgi:uncharacterized membrane-anchored protein